MSNIPNEIRKKYKEVEWRKIKGFRDVSTHQYWNMDVAYEWYIIQNKLDILEKQIKEILENEK